MLRAIVWYQRGAKGRPSPCRFFPSCSEYGYEAISTHGAGRGLWLTVRRLSRCRPFGPSGFDPVPLPRDRALAECSDHDGHLHDGADHDRHPHDGPVHDRVTSDRKEP